MNKESIERITSELEESLYELHRVLYREFSQDWKSFTININDKIYEIDALATKETKNEVIKYLIIDVVNFLLENSEIFTDADDIRDPYNVIHSILNGARTEDNQKE